MTSILLVGAFGQDNPGDDALLEAFLESLEGPDITVATRRPGETRARFGCRTIDVDGASVLRELPRSDIVVAAGGTIFKQLHPDVGRPEQDLLRRALLLVSTAKTMGKLVGLVGVGAGRIEGASARAMVRAIVRRSDLLVLRDEESADVLAEAGAPGPFRIGADPAWALLRDPHRERPRAEAVIVALSHVAGDGGLAGQLACALLPIVERGLRVELQPWQGKGPASDDLRLAREVRGLLEGRVKIIGRPPDLRQARSLFARRLAVIGLRHHSLVAAAASRTPFVGFAHEPKIAGICRRMSQPSVSVGCAPGELEEAFSCAIEGSGPDLGAVEEQIQLAEESFGFLRLLDPDARAGWLDDFDGLPLYQPSCPR